MVGLAGTANPSRECFSGWLTAVGLCTSDLPQIMLESCQLDPIRPWCFLFPSLSHSPSYPSCPRTAYLLFKIRSTPKCNAFVGKVSCIGDSSKNLYWIFMELKV